MEYQYFKEFLIGGGIALVIAIITFFVSKSKQKKLFSIQVAEKASCGEIKKTSQEVAKEIGAGSFNQYSKIYGKVTTPTPLTSPFSEKPCVYYASTVYRKYESVETYTDENGKERQRRITGEEIVSSEKDQIPFMLNDGTGEIEVSTQGVVREDLVQALNRFVPGAGGRSLSLGRFSFNLPAFGAASQTLGYRYQEYIFPVNRNALVIGNITDNSGNLRFEKPEDKDYKFLLTTKSEDEYISTTKKGIKVTKILSAVFLAATAVLAILPFILK